MATKDGYWTIHEMAKYCKSEQAYKDGELLLEMSFYEDTNSFKFFIYKNDMIHTLEIKCSIVYARKQFNDLCAHHKVKRVRN